MPSVHIHHVHLLLIAQTAAKRAVEDAKRPNALTDDSLIAIVVAATAAEAFINELSYYLQLLGDTRAHWAPIGSILLACANVIDEVEVARGPLQEKYLAASSALSGTAFDKGTSAFQDFEILIKLRNAIVHLKPGDAAGLKWTDVLATRDLALPASTHLHWFDRLLIPANAAWAVQTARHMMLRILEMAPRQYDTKELEPLIGWEELLREHPGFAETR
jgi:hypothetical protein